MTLDDYTPPEGWVAEVPAIAGCYALMASKGEKGVSLPLDGQRG